MLAYNALLEMKTTRSPRRSAWVSQKQSITSVVTQLSLTLTTHRCGGLHAGTYIYGPRPLHPMVTPSRPSMRSQHVETCT